MAAPLLAVAPHPLLWLRALAVDFPQPLGSLRPAAPLAAQLTPAAAAPLPRPDDALRGHIRDLLRHGGFKPTGRNKPSSEYLVRAAEEGKWPAINVAADAGNTVSLHSGIPISVVDLDRVRPPLQVQVAPEGAAFVFNPSGQVIDAGGLLGLADADGPCANAVKDAQRSKTDAATKRVLVLVWGHAAVRGQVDAAAAWARDLLQQAGGRVDDVVAGAEAAP